MILRCYDLSQRTVVCRARPSRGYVPQEIYDIELDGPWILYQLKKFSGTTAPYSSGEECSEPVNTVLESDGRRQTKMRFSTRRYVTASLALMK